MLEDLLKLNQLADWRGCYAAVSHVVDGGSFMMPPKFFGGNPDRLHQDFVLAISLNHKALKDSKSAELLDYQKRDTCLKAHQHYFRQEYVYSSFFKPRASVLRAYAATRGLGVPADWRFVNEQYSLYLEGYPTFSEKFKAPRAQLENEVFVMALNRLAHEVVLGLLRPRAVLLAGRGTWSLLPESSNPIAASPKCLGTLDSIKLNPGVDPVAVLRCNFLRTVHGPNTTSDLEELGRLLAK
jgi:hypothetical protein